MTKRLRIHLLREDAKLPTYAHPDDIGMDLYAVEDVTIYSFFAELCKVNEENWDTYKRDMYPNPLYFLEANRPHIAIASTGISVEVPEGYELQIRSRSGLAAKKSIFVLNSPGTIDEGYRGEIKVILANLGYENYCIGKGCKLAQMVLCPVEKAEIIPMNSFQRGQGGFGSTGV